MKSLNRRETIDTLKSLRQADKIGYKVFKVATTWSADSKTIATKWTRF